MPYLTGVTDSFRNAVAGGNQTPQLRAVVQAVSDYTRAPNAIQFRTLTQALAAWQRNHPVDYQNRLRYIRGDFDAELAQHAARYGPGAVPANNMTWVQAVSHRLEPFKDYAVGDILDFMGNSTPDARQDCLARYADFAHAQPEPPRRGMRVAGVVIGTAWNANRLRMMNDYVTYATQRTVRYTPSRDVNVTPATGTGTVSINSRGCAVCTEFAFAAAHVLTDGRADGPRVEVVSWMGGIRAAHCFVIVGRQLAGGAQNRLPPPSVANWGPDVVIVDVWLAALGHKVAYRLTAGDYPYPGFLTPVSLLMARP